MLTPASKGSFPRLPIASCESLFEKLKWEYSQLERQWDSPYVAFNFSVTAYHLYQDWIKKAGSAEQKNRRDNLPANGKLLFEVWRDVTNATKHWELNQNSQDRQVVSRISNPEISDWYAYFVTGPVYYVRVNKSYVSFSDLAYVTGLCFRWILLDDPAITRSILECQLALLFRDRINDDAND